MVDLILFLIFAIEIARIALLLHVVVFANKVSQWTILTIANQSKSRRTKWAKDLTFGKGQEFTTVRPPPQVFFFILIDIRGSRAKQLRDLDKEQIKIGARSLIPFSCKMQSMTNDGARLIFIFTSFYHLLTDARKRPCDCLHWKGQR
jgi:hypothetical protein